VNQRSTFIRQPDRIVSYFKSEVPVLIVVTISGLIYNIGMVAGPYFEGRLAQCLYDIFHHRAVWHDMLTLALLYVAVIGGVQIMRAVKRFSVRRFANNVSRDMRRCLYNSLVHPEAGSLADESLGSLLTKAIADVDACTEGMRKFTTELFDTGVVMIAYVVMLARYDWRLTILACLFTPLAYFAADKLKTRVTAANAAYKQSESVLNGVTLDRIDHAVTYRLFGREADRNAAAETALTDYEKKSAWANLYEGATTPLYDAIAMIGAVMILYFGARNVTGTGWTAWNIAAFTTFLACFTKLAVKASHAAKLFNSVQKAAVSWKRIQPLMREAVEDDFTVMDHPVQPAALTFDDVACGYRAPDFLRHLSFTANPGEMIGITGEIASGKSLLGKVLIGEAPYTGTITVGGQNFTEMDAAARLKTFTYMGHEPELLSTSFRDNVALGDAVDADAFLKRTAMDRDLAAMGRTPDSPVGAGGGMLSGGQQARLALARTLAHARSIVILDDPFAAVDQATETQIFSSIRRHGQNRTLLLMSHRLAHFPECDRVLYLHDGTATFLTHDAMLKAEPGYRALYLTQIREGVKDQNENQSEK
jgi:ATP-binding cassette subfamily B multidrug efflux pump